MKKFTAVFLSLTVTLALAACGQKTTGATTAAAAVETSAAETTKAPETTAAPATEAPAALAAETTAAETTKAPETTAPETTATAAEKDRGPSVLLHPVEKNYYECQQREDNTFVYEIEGSMLELGEAEAKAYPYVDMALKEDYNNYAEMQVAEFIEQYLENTEGRTDLDGTKPFVQKSHIVRMDSNMVSILYQGYQYLGGAHGYTVLQSFNYKTDEKANVDLSEIVKDNEKLQQILVEKLKSEYPENTYFDLEKDIKAYVLDTPAEEGKIAYTWTMDYDSLQIYFMEDSLGPHANGSQMIDLAFADYPELLVNSYGTAPTDYIRKLEPYTEWTVDGKKLQADYRVDEYGTYSKLVFTVNGKETVFDIFAGDVQTWYATRNGHGFFYTFAQGDDDEHPFTIYKIDGDTVTELQKMNGFLTVTQEKTEAIGSFTGMNPYAVYNRVEVPVDPAAVKVTVGDAGNRKDVTVAIEEDGTVTVK